MTRARQTSTLVGLAALLLLAGCSTDAQPGGAGTATGRPSSPPASTMPAATVPPSPSTCPPKGTTTIPDGSWTGTLEVKVRGSAPETATRGTGSGQLQVLVERGRVTGGTWALTWDAAGPSTAKDSRSTVQLHGQIAGTVTGTAAKPAVGGRWTVTGSAAVTAPVTATAAIDEAGRSDSTLAVRTTSCDAVAGTFTVSFRSTDAFATSEGTARWAGRRTG